MIHATATASIQDKGALVERLRANIPGDLRELRRWVVWRYKDRLNRKTGELKKTKVPFRVAITKQEPASSTDPDTWDYFGSALVALELGPYDGVAFAMAADDPYCFVDLDHCRNAETGEVAEWAMRYIRELRSYTEISPSGTGIHILVRGELPPVDRRAGNIEMYDSGRFASMSGHIFEAR